MKQKDSVLRTVLRSLAAVFIAVSFALFLFGSSGASPQWVKVSGQSFFKGLSKANGHAYVELKTPFASDFAFVRIPKKIVHYNAPVDENRSGHVTTVIPVANSPPGKI